MDPGFYGFLDFVGYPVGLGVFVPHGGGGNAWTKVCLQRMIAEEAHRDSLVKGEIMKLALLNRIASSWEVFEKERNAILWNNAMAVISAEV